MNNPYADKQNRPGDRIIKVSIFFRNRKLYFLSKVASIIYQLSYRNNIPVHTIRFGSDTIFAHGGFGTVINGDTIIGNKCWIGPNVLIVAKDNHAPIIGDSCMIGAGAILVGNIRIGDNTIIGAGAVVVDDIPAGAVIVGPKARNLS